MSPPDPPQKRKESDLVVKTDYKILYEDEFLLVVDKPAPLPVHPVGRFVEKTLLSLLEKEVEHPLGDLHVVNRLDSETSGLVLVAKHKAAAGCLAQQFEKREVEKEYLAILFGSPQPPEGKIAAPLGPEIKQSYHLVAPDSTGQEAITFYEVLSAAENYSLVKVLPLTGRKHQIRVHFASIGHPVVGDKIYIDLAVYDQYVREGWKEEMRDSVKLPRLALHASRLKFSHPEGDKKMEFCSELPSELSDFLENLSC